MKHADAAKVLLRLADEAEAIGREQFARSAQAADPLPRSDFGNALAWGRKAQGYRMAAAALHAHAKKVSPVRRRVASLRVRLRAAALRWL